ncbi:MAG: RpiB/LacA/LacB family sugar-phosphate isomerase [Minisyncoccia bacterium]
MSKIFIAADHAGFSLKEELKPFLTELGHEVEDCGAHAHVDGDDFPDYVRPCAERVAVTQGSFGIVIGASGQGEAMAANRIPRVRAAVYYGDPHRTQTDTTGHILSLLEAARAHNDANILSLGARFLTKDEAKTAVSTFLATSFGGESHHLRRIEKLG